MTNLKISRLKGNEILPYINDLAELRMSVFREYPYLYEGNIEYEIKYLSTYTQCKDSVMIVVSDLSKIIGASTAIPLKFETIEFQKPFLDLEMDVNDIFYFGESVLEKSHRGQGIYRYFFHEREQAAKSYGCKLAAFCAVERAENDKRRPPDYESLDNIWKHFGYEKHPEIATTFNWKEVGETEESPKPMTFWLKKL